MYSNIAASTISRKSLYKNSNNHKVTTKLHRREWRGRSRTGKGNTWLSNAILDGGMPIQLIAAATILASHVHNETLSIRLGEADAAVLFGKSRSQAGRYLDALELEGHLTVRRGDTDEYGGYLPNLYTLNLTPKKRPQATPKPVDSESKNDPTPRVINESRFLIKNCSLNTKTLTTPPYPPQAGDVCESLEKPERYQNPEPSRPTHDPEVWKAQEQAKVFREERRARQAAKRQSHYAEVKVSPRFEGRSRRHHEPLTPVQVAAAEVMLLLGIAVPRERLRRAIEGAVEMCSRRTGKRPESCVEPLVLSWAEYERAGSVLFAPVGMERFYGEGVWIDPNSWRCDRTLLRRHRIF